MSTSLPDGTILRATRDRPISIRAKKGDLIRLLPYGRAETLKDHDTGWHIVTRTPEYLRERGLVPVDQEPERALADYKVKVRQAILAHFAIDHVHQAGANSLLSDLDLATAPVHSPAAPKYDIVSQDDGTAVVYHRGWPTLLITTLPPPPA